MNLAGNNPTTLNHNGASPANGDGRLAESSSSQRLRIAVFVEKRPRGPVVLFPVATVEGRDVLDSARRSVGKPVVDDLAREDLARLRVFDLVPFGARKTDARHPLATCEDNPTIDVVPRVWLILTKDRKLDAVNLTKFVQRHS